ncbi:hypothetical protein EDC04DRAFT_2668780 [Pisolithus marmoratus]|nr:hypothetical protein EDC04DRAFT_2668780 [Pisolithus marmoratus]
MHLFDSFNPRGGKRRINDLFSQPIIGVAGRTTARVLNVVPYNYLGFTYSREGCAYTVEEPLRCLGVRNTFARWYL